jgi:hypothetical protein
VCANPVVVDQLQKKVGVTFTPAQGEGRERREGDKKEREEERGREMTRERNGDWEVNLFSRGT